MRRRFKSSPLQAPRGYRPRRAWLGMPGDGAAIRPRRSTTHRWGFRWLQLRILLLALAVAACAWPLLWRLPG